MKLRVLATLILIAGTAHAQSPSQAIESVLELNRNALAAQKRIDKIYAERQQVLSDINTIEQEDSIYALRNRELEDSVSRLRENLAEIDSDLQAITETQTGIVTLTGAMIDTLERFIELDLPFELHKRLNVIEKLRRDLLRADIDVTQKYQAVVSAYLAEIRLGYSHAVSQERIATPTGERLVEVLRIGRAGLWYVTPDGTEAGRWDPVQRHWTDTDTDPLTVQTGIRIVRETGSPTIISLPVRLDIS